jgi:pimeloyl-ACP methyl ester carboxylesterase
MITVPAPPTAATATATRPPVLLVHGIGSSFQHNWGNSGWFDLLADAGRTVLGFELPGHGESSSWTVETKAQAVDQLLADVAAHSGNGPIDVVGFSAGAQMVAWTAAQHPSAFRRIVLLGLGDSALEPVQNGPIDLAQRLLEPDESSLDAQDRLFRRMARSAGNDLPAVARYLNSQQPPLSPARLGAVKSPTLVLLGDRDWGLPADGLAAAFPNGRLQVLRGVDHFALTSNFSCLDAVLEFLAEESV